MKRFAIVAGALAVGQVSWAQSQSEATPIPGDSDPLAQESLAQDKVSDTTLSDSDSTSSEPPVKEGKSLAEVKPTEKTLEGESLSFIIPESAALPTGVFRFRTVYGSAQSTTSYDGEGKKDPSTDGFELSVSGLAFALEYGVTDRLSAQLLVPWSLGGEVKLADENLFKSRTDVRARVETAVDEKLAPLLSSLKTNFGAGWDANIAAPSDINDPSSGSVLIPAGTPVQDGFDAVRRSAIATGLNQAVASTKSSSERERTDGLGDVEIGARYSLSTVAEPWIRSVPLYTSLAAGLRLNTSDYSKSTEKGEIPAGRGTTDLGLRINIDYEPIRGLQLQIENQSEVMVASGDAYSAPKDLGGEEKELTRDGVRQIGYTKLVLAPGAWIDPVRFLLLSARLNWDNDPQTKVSDAIAGPLQIKRSMQYGVSLDGLKYQVPVQLDYDYIMALESPSTRFAVDAHQVQFKLYYKF